ncbi:MAG: hypothetical protein FJ379_03005 [Verrucomicrobia bacterium]|nr:hypothetical protein [Verrucomicrobiota bacterium]
MSPIRILQGLFVGGLILAGALTAYWQLGFNPNWILWSVFSAGALATGLMAEIRSRCALRTYRERPCTGIRWHRRFPETPKQQIREFLDQLIEAFGFHDRRRLCFRPEDRVMDVYRSVHPPGDLVDSMELESFCRSLRNHYGVDVAASWHEEISLGEIYERIHTVA